MKKWNPSDHVNYTHLVGELTELQYREVNANRSSYLLCELEVATEFRGKKHKPDRFQVIFWDKLADALNSADVSPRIGVIPGDIIAVEGRLTRRELKDSIHYSVTGNKVRVLRKPPKKEAFLQEIKKVGEENG